MWALIESGNITAVYNTPRAIKIEDIQYPANIFTLWSQSELNAIGIYEVIQDLSNFKDKKYYTNTNDIFTYDSSAGTVTRSFGTATAKPLNDSTDENGVVSPGLKTVHKNIVDSQAYTHLQSSDWMVVRNAEISTAIPSDWSDYRASVRSTATSMKEKIDAVSDIEGFIALYTYSGSPSVRPLGEWPTPPAS
tara:strand:- start:7868 stop:8443 length:576 start_codon:yes stop_codon:yes gene_type:complete